MAERLVAEAVSANFSNEYAEELLTIVPQPLIHAECFLDSMTGLWRYEFGLPYHIDAAFVWGTHMWVPVKYLFVALSCARSRLSGAKLTNYLTRLADPDRHQATVVEMAPLSKVHPSVPADFEVTGLGQGNRTVDWAIGPHGGRTVLLDVKRRTADLIAQFQAMRPEDAAAPEPEHDPALMFRSVEQKFMPVDVNSQLQGVWIATDIKQDTEELTCAFNALDPGKVHFVVLGDWEPDIYVLSRRPEDTQYLLNLFRAKESARFTFTRRHEG